MSVTYGAGGTGAGYTVELASGLKKKGVVPLAHLTCVGATKEKTRAVLTSLREAGIENILALRGDLPDQPVRLPMDYQHASDLVKEIEDFGGFCVGGACYPESHPESENCFADVRHLKKKVEAGCEFLTTQMFFDNNILYNFIYRLREAGVQVPVVAGIMPVTSASQIKRIIGISGQRAAPALHPHCRPLRRSAGGLETGWYRLCHRTDYRFICQRNQRCSRLFHEQTGSGAKDTGKCVGHHSMTRG